MLGFWGQLADRKYNIQEQQARAGMISAQAQQRNAETGASLAPVQIADTQAQTALRQAQAAELPLEGAATRDLIGAQAGMQRASAAQTQRETSMMRPVTPNMLAAFSFLNRGNWLGPTDLTQGMLAPTPEPEDETGPTGPRVRRGTQLGFAMGTARVPGTGSPTKDTVPAKLAPGEAVLNKPAADILGRGLIAALNAKGAARMGLI